MDDITRLYKMKDVGSTYEHRVFLRLTLLYRILPGFVYVSRKVSNLRVPAYHPLHLYQSIILSSKCSNTQN
jgi:hypothetical protein